MSTYEPHKGLDRSITCIAVLVVVKGDAVPAVAVAAGKKHRWRHFVFSKVHGFVIGFVIINLFGSINSNL